MSVQDSPPDPAPFVQNVNVMGDISKPELNVVYAAGNAWLRVGPLSLFGAGDTALEQVRSIEAFARAVLAQCEAERQSLREQAGLEGSAA